MPKILVTTREGDELVVEARAGQSAMQAIRNAGVDELAAICGGACSCATCHVYVEADALARLRPMSADEDAMLDCSDHRRPNSRLSCQIILSDGLGDLPVEIAPED